MSNHNIWRTCPHCGYEYDTHLHGLTCPQCHNLNELRHIVGKTIVLAIIAGLIILAVLL